MNIGEHAYNTFLMCTAIKLHFKDFKYDYFKYNGKLNVDGNTFGNLPDKYMYYKIAKKITNVNDMMLFLVSNIMENPSVWVGDLNTQEAEELYRNKMRILQSMTYIFENDCNTIFEGVTNPSDVLKPIDGDLPKILKLYKRNKITFETVVIINMIINFIPNMDKRIVDTIQYPAIRKKLIKYTPFLNVDIKKYKSILKRCVYDK